MAIQAYPYASDIGVSSIDALQALARSSGVPFTVTSSYRPTDTNSYHSKQNAIDMATSADQMVKLASYLYQYAPFLLELIHSGGGGFFVKNGVKVDAAFYAKNIAGHYDHVHLAATLSGLRAASDKGIIVGEPIKTGSFGCLKPAVTTAAIMLAPIIGGLTWLIR